METELQHSTNGHSGNFTPPDAKPLLCLGVHSPFLN